MQSLADPWILLLLPLPLALRWLMRPRPAAHDVMIVPAGVGARLDSMETEGSALARLPWLEWLVWALLVLSLAGPRLAAPAAALPVSGRDLVLSLDLSGSMVREDFAIDGRTVSRLDAVKTVASDFVRRRAGDRVGLIVFGSEAYYATPLTFDVEAVAKAVDEAVIGISGRATSISDGLGLALKRLAVSDATSRVVILLSDGANNSGAVTPRGAAGLARDLGVKVHTIALGPKDETTAEEGERGVVDAATLRAISDISGGQTFRVRTTEDLVTVADAIDQLEANAAAGLSAEIYDELWIYPAALALMLSLALVVRGRQT